MPHKGMAGLPSRNLFEQRCAPRTKPASLSYNRHMRRHHPAAAIARIFVLTFALAALATAQGSQQKDAPAKESAPDVPDAIAVPSGLDPVLFVHATGSQI